MASAAKRPAGRNGKAAKNALVAQALNTLRDPEVRAELVKHGRVVMDAVQQWKADRPKRNGPSVTDRLAERVGGRFGQKGLERREANLRAAVAAVSADSSTLGASLRPVTKSLDDVARLLKVAAALPLVKRKRAHRKIDDVLDDLESGFFDATLQGARPAPTED